MQDVQDEKKQQKTHRRKDQAPKKANLEVPKTEKRGGTDSGGLEGRDKKK